MRARRFVLALLVAVLAGACGGDDGDGGRVVLDGRARIPDAEGVVSDVSRESIALENGKRWRLVDKPQSFSTYTLATVNLLQRKGQYVQVGLDGDRVAWVAAIGAVAKLDPPVVFYNGELERMTARQVVFKDGTVLRLGTGVVSPVTTGFVRVEIDPDLGVVRRIALP